MSQRNVIVSLVETTNEKIKHEVVFDLSESVENIVTLGKL